MRHLFFAASALALLAAAPALATTAQSGALNVVANSTIAGGGPVTSVDNQSWAGAPATLNASAFAQATAPNSQTGGVDFVATSGSAMATWASADAGTVTFSNYGWDFEVGDPANAGVGSNLTQNRGGSDWSYTFTATSNGVFTMKYDVVGSGATFGLWGWGINGSGGGSGGPVLMPGDPTTSGVFTMNLLSGGLYTVTLDGNPNIFSAGTLNNYTGSMNGEFDWSISNSVPEPAAWALMITGFGLAGVALRRRGLVAA